MAGQLHMTAVFELEGAWRETAKYDGLPIGNSEVYKSEMV